ncbi:Aste57867_8662 [Aphanomyces stellatus]|uniref:Aste57867_8662 protein n=1 Tax=Aphanomyces stellatus TaxID=120398 RepID=A0A485KL26_9STRA|nr:hypothetical protein As57867_008628 [Aphanomyces stellatus]VFT85548.1 Aste57867_8662 [Aphanomyces stellatus]
MKLPLPPNFFKCPPLTTDETERLKQQAYATAMDVVQKSLIQPSDTLTWSLLSNDNGLKIYRGKDSRGDAVDHLKLSVGVAEIAGTIEEVVELFRNDTTEHAKEYVNRFGKGLLDSANLYTLVEPSEVHPNESVTINWMALKSPLKAVVMERDCCYLEGHYQFEINGKRGWVRSLKSLNLMCCPDMQHALGLVRMIQMGTGHVFLESDRPGYMRIAYVVHADFKGAATEWAIDKAVKRRCTSLLDIDTFLRENRLAQGHFLSGDQLVPKDTRRQCFLCQKKFGVFVSKSNCVKCGEVFCGACNHAWTVKVCGIPTRIDACTKCALVAPTESKALLSNQFSDTRSLSYASSRESAGAGANGMDMMIHMNGPLSTAQTPSAAHHHLRHSKASSSSSSSTSSMLTHMAAPAPAAQPQWDPLNTNEKWIQALIASKSLLAADAVAEKNTHLILSPTQLQPIMHKKRSIAKNQLHRGSSPEDRHEVEEVEEVEFTRRPQPPQQQLPNEYVRW